MTTNNAPTIDELFPFEYMGGGYFRQKGIKKGDQAPTLHGKQVAQYLHEKIMIAFSEIKEQKETIDKLRKIVEDKEAYERCRRIRI